KNAAASGPLTQISPICERSNMPTALRTAWCSSSSLPYFSGIFQGPKAVKDAPSFSCSACSGDCRSSDIDLSLLGGIGVGIEVECLWRWAGAHQVAVAVSFIQAAYRWEVLVQTQ